MTTKTFGLITISEAAKILRVSPDTLRNWEKQGKLIPERTTGGARRYKLSDLQALAKEKTQPLKRPYGLINVSKASKLLGVSKDTIRNWANKGLIISERTEGGARRFSKSEIKRLQQEMGLRTSQLLPQNLETSPILPSHPQLSLNPIENQQNSKTISLIPVIGIISLLLLLAVGLISAMFIYQAEDSKNKIAVLSSNFAKLAQNVENIQQNIFNLKLEDQNKSKSTLNEPTKNTSYLYLPANLSLNDVAKKGNTTDQSLTLNSGVSFGNVVKLGSLPKDPTHALNGDTYYNTTSNYFRCYQNGSWKDCDTNTSVDTSSLITLGPSSTQTITPQTQTAVGLSIAQGNGGTVDIFNVKSNDGLTKYFNIDSAGQVIINGSTNVGIGTSSPGSKLDIYQSTSSSDTNLFRLLSDVGSSANVKFRVDSDGDIFTDGSTTIGAPADVAENYSFEEPLEAGDVVAVGTKSSSNSPSVRKAALEYDQTLLGVISTDPGIILSGDTKGVPVALSGRVPIKVSTKNGSIKKGDLLTSSNIPGIAIKATKPGYVVAKALENYDSNEPGKVLAFINLTYADPTNLLASLVILEDGKLSILPKTNPVLILDPSIKIDAVVTDTNFETTKLLTVGSTASDKISDLEKDFLATAAKIKSLDEKLDNQNLAILDQQQKTGELEKKIETTSSALSLLQQNLEKFVSNKPSQKELLTANQNNPSTLDLTPLETVLASDSANLTNSNISKNISNLQISDNFKSLGNTFLGNTTIAGDLIADGTLSISNGNQINVIGVDCTSSTSNDCNNSNDTSGVLFIQNSPLAIGLDIFNGKIIMDKSGNIKAQSVTVAEFKVYANNISGSATIKAGEKSTEVSNLKVQPNSRILVTPTSDSGVILGVIQKNKGKSFMVSATQEVKDDLSFDYFIISEE